MKQTSGTTINLIARDASDFLRQSPTGDGLWADVRFLANAAEVSDYCVVFTGVKQPLKVHCRRDNIWLLMQEPPTEFFKPLHRGNNDYGRIFTQDTDLVGSRYVWTQPANPWHVKRSYAELKRMTPGVKSNETSAVVSNMAMFQGHRDRLAFLSRMKACMALDHYGRGFREIADKWDALAPYRYSLAVENYRNPFYWTEKIVDCFLAWTMPIYCGCTRITDFFPAEAMLCFDMDDPNALDKIRSAIAGDAWGKNRDAIEYARNLVLDRYQLLPFLADQVRAHASSCGVGSNVYREHWVHPVVVKPGLPERCRKYVRRVAGLGKRLIGQRSARTGL
jgi:hypothetical protein